MLNGTPVLESSWYSVMRKHTYHEEHHHLPSVWSGVYYVQADQTHPGLTFVNRNQKTHWPRTGVKELTEFNHDVEAHLIKGFHRVFKSIFPIEDLNDKATLEYVSYRL